MLMVSYPHKQMIPQRQQTQQRQPHSLRDEVKYKLAHSFLSAHNDAKAAAQCVANWDTETALETIAELLKNCRFYARYNLKEWREMLVLDLISSLVPALILAPTLKWLSLTMLIPAFLVGILMRQVWPFRTKILRQKLIWALEALLPQTSPSMLPIILEVAVCMGNPEQSLILQRTLTRLLPHFNISTVQTLTLDQHHYLLRLLKIPDEDLAIATLLAIETIADHRDADAVRFDVACPNKRVHLVRQECLELLEVAKKVS
ncbi:hypothetical protein [Armatimonas sp.]|uniref:hypothetical protein n=1 Tax=Armatimonas sp. TaxID=1872638 RepID=UPI00286A626E|nr:hypothetical protein [Armatimonas sp.]